MISLEKYRELLESDGHNNLSDEEVLKIRNSIYGLGEIIFEDYIDSIKDKKANENIK